MHVRVLVHRVGEVLLEGRIEQRQLIRYRGEYQADITTLGVVPRTEERHSELVSGFEAIGDGLSDSGLARSRDTVQPEYPTLLIPFRRQSPVCLDDLFLEPATYRVKDLRPGISCA